MYIIILQTREELNDKFLTGFALIQLLDGDYDSFLSSFRGLRYGVLNIKIKIEVYQVFILFYG